MNDRDELVGEVEADPIEVSSNAMGEFLDAIQGQNFTQAERHFNDMMMDRIQDSLEQRKVQIASQMFNGDDEEEDESDPEDDELLDLSDDEIEELFDEVEDEDDDEEEDEEEDE